MPFQKGNKLGGARKKTPAQILFEQRCREYLSTKGWKRLEAMADSNEMADVKYAMDKIVNHGVGRPIETVDMNHNEGPAEDPRTDEEVKADARARLERLGGPQNGPNGTGLPKGA